jgi:hypothetical protein
MANREFTDVLDELIILHNLKNKDYATSENPYKNLQGVERIGLDPWKGVVIRMMDKFSRIEEFCVKEELAVKDETIEDTLKDLSIYAVLALILYRKRNDEESYERWSYLDTLDKAKAQEQSELERGKGKVFDLPKIDPPEWELPDVPEHQSLFPQDRDNRSGL